MKMIINLNQFGNSGGGSGSTVAWRQDVTAGTQIAQITIDGTSQDVYAPEGEEVVQNYQIVSALTEVEGSEVTSTLDGYYIDFSGAQEGDGIAVTNSGYSEFPLYVMLSNNSLVDSTMQALPDDNTWHLVANEMYFYKRNGLDFSVVFIGEVPTTSSTPWFIYFLQNPLTLEDISEEMTYTAIAEGTVAYVLNDGFYQYIGGDWQARDYVSASEVGEMLENYTEKSHTEESEEVISRALNELSANVGGGDSLPEIDTLPENPVDGSVYNYRGRLIKYVNGAGNWGEWRAPINRVSQSAPVERKQDSVLHYVSIPSSMNGQLVCKATWNNSQNIFFFYNQSNSTLDAYSDSAATTPLTTGATISMDGVEVESANGVIKVYTTWTDGEIVFQTRASTHLINQVCSTSTNDPHYELYQVNNSPIGIDTGSTEYSKTVYTDEYGNVVGLGFSVKEGEVKVNGNTRVYLQENGPASNYNLPDFYAPTASGASGTILVSAGNTAPVWQTLQTALGISAIWTGTQAQYEALAPNYDNTTLYFIVEE